MAQSLGKEEEALLGIYGDEEMISLATGSKKPISQAPSAATVITAREIKEMGATELDQVLETVPGLQVSVNALGYDPIYTFRGMYSQYNPQVLMLVNGIPITSVYLGNRGQAWPGMPVQSIARIEVIRGPGSALYGANAFAGVINVITKTKEDIDGTELGGRAGSFNTWDGWALHGGTWGGFDVAFMAQYHNTGGSGQIINADAQTLFDQAFGTHASLAPGPVNLQRQNIDVRLDISRQYWRFRAGLQRLQNAGDGVGLAQALDPVGQFGNNQVNADLTYHNPEFSKNWDMTAQLSYFRTDVLADQLAQVYPPGAFNNTFPAGVFDGPETFENHVRLGVEGAYTGFDSHRIHGGTGVRYAELNAQETKNYSINGITGLPQPLPTGLTNVSNNPGQVFMPSGKFRINYYAFLQDTWNLARDWEFTAGLRYDEFSDFGSTLNPRVALVWLTRYNLTTKLLYGRAFRAPSFAELYGINNPAILGNPHLQPETVNTVELAFNYRPVEKLSVDLSLFHYIWNSMIQFVPDSSNLNSIINIARNVGGQTGSGFELGAEWKIRSNLRLLGNYSFQYSTNDQTGGLAANAPQNHIYARLNWEFLPNWHFNPQVNWVGFRPRAAGDPRPSLGGYTIFDFTLRRMMAGNRWEAAFSVRNLFNDNAREPSLLSGSNVLVPNDLPLLGRNFYGEIRLHF
ncbi:TonB-dependent receptor plug [Candidatus Nitrosoglobus terrae]|uniref:TonB-dependent receptor plug n=1 Tax=Candidatus Nitrosoglobus terrae TaxID=1630141 RepID=A0A1Q2SMG4_9GAMM|nr:TonB-dependent receptor [Candidatus Nitrosoglobus terrae]BAW80312.1 TonB-dependent receptor plug [Candidatus Nitrosoglobus terrae]